jgi:hypothetical protein
MSKMIMLITFLRGVIYVPKMLNLPLALKNDDHLRENVTTFDKNLEDDRVRGDHGRNRSVEDDHVGSVEDDHR